MGDWRQGRPYPIGPSIEADGVNFSIYSRQATAVDLLLFDDVDDARPSRVIPLDPNDHRTHHYWHVKVAGLSAGQLYGYRASGPYDPLRRQRFDDEKLLIDPYGRGVATGANYDRRAAARPGCNFGAAMKSVLVDTSDYDWEGDRPLERPYSETVIYEMHVGGFTRHPSSGLAEELRGTYRGLIERIPYLVDLGVTAVELLPVFQFDEQDCPQGLSNYWGYSPVSFFAPHTGYSVDREPMAAVREFRDMVKALHRAGIEVILDVVYNHTAEGDELGPTFCFRGLDDSTYYLFEQHADTYSNFSGTGNALKSNHSIVRRLILEPRSWPATNRASPRAVRPSSTPSTPIPGWPPRRSSPRPGTPAGSTRLAASSATVGRSGTASSGTTSGGSSRGTKAPSDSFRPACWAARTCTPTSSGNPARASTSSPATTALRSTTWFPTSTSTTRATSKAIATARTIT
jgi:glycogen debranching enzyme GlgX